MFIKETKKTSKSSNFNVKVYNAIRKCTEPIVKVYNAIRKFPPPIVNIYNAFLTRKQTYCEF